VHLRQLVSDANIITTPNLDILHFPFANNLFGRQHYGEILDAVITISFRGSDLNVYPIYNGKSYNQLWSFVSKVQCNSIELAEKLKNHAIPPSLSTAIIPPALRLDLESVETVKIELKKIGTIDNPLVLISLGRLHWVKDYPLALRIMTELKKQGLHFRYNILGEGVEGEQLMFLIQELGLSTEVKLFGSVDVLDIKKHFKSGHIYLQTSLAEGFSNACLEAQAFGLPCIVPAISGMRDCVEDGKTGIIVKDRSEKAFADAILSIINNFHNIDPSYISRRVKIKFSLENQRQQWNNFFKEFHN
jgi:colanic acid/amylovoran biosynthesis glycosyltransferase